MDSFTQIVLGAGCASALVPQKKRAMLYGAALGTLPDLDALIPFNDPIDALVLHRSASHSLLVLSLLAPLLYLLARRFDPVLREPGQRWFWAFYVALVTHPLLDWTTIYGTQLFWPISTEALGLGSMFIIDPIYTLVLLIALIWQWRRPSSRASAAAVLISTAYLGWSALTQYLVTEKVERELAKSQPETARSAQKLLVSAAPLTTLLHRVVLRESGGYREAYVSAFTDSAPISWQHHRSEDHYVPLILGRPESRKNFQRLSEFSDGFYSLEMHEDAHGGHIIYSDLRMGEHGTYVFRFELGSQHAALETARQLPSQRPPMSRLGWLWHRIWRQAPPDATHQ